MLEAREEAVTYEPGRILMARQMTGVTQRELAAKSGIGQGRLSRLQNGVLPLTTSTISIIAKALDFPESFFAVSGQAFPMSELTYRKTSKTSMRLLAEVGAEFSALEAAVQRLRRKLRLKNRAQWIDELAPHGNALSGERIERIAVDARSALGVPVSGAIRNLTRSLERSGIVVAPLYSIGGHGELHPDGEGICRPDDDNPIIGHFALGALPGARLRFAIAHELGHLILHRYRKTLSPRVMEREARRFAGALFLPQEDAERELSADSTLLQYVDVKAAWGVSVADTIRRAYDLGIVDENRYQSLNIQLTSRGWRKKEPVMVENERAVLFQQMMRAAYSAGSIDEVATDLPIDSFAAVNELGIPFRYLDYWAEGLREEGEELGFQETRFPKRS